MKKLLLISLIIISTTAFASERDDDEHGHEHHVYAPHQIQGQQQQQWQAQGQYQGQQSYNSNHNNAEAAARANSYSNSAANSSSNSGLNSNISSSVNPNQSTNSSNQSSSTGNGSNNSTTFSNKYPNQAPPIYTTSSPSFSQRNCTPVGSVNGSGPFGGLGIAFPMGGDTCNGLNISDKMKEWRTDSSDERLWLVECNLMVAANDELEEAFEKSGYSCQAAYNERVSKIRATAQQQALNNAALQKRTPGL